MAERVVVTNHDLIGYRNPAYLGSPDTWRRLRDVTRHALALADHVVFPSAHALADALSDDLVAPDRAAIVPNGVDHRPRADAAPPPGWALPETSDLILCLGADYTHKNRTFALRVADSLLREHDWTGHLVLAGPSVGTGGSAYEEAALLSTNPGLAAHTLRLGPVSEESKEWLFQHASLVIYPTVYEGFGLVPFEAAAHDVPCLWAATASLETLLGHGSEIVMWDASATARRAHELIRDAAAARSNIERIRVAGVGLTWENAACGLLEVYRRTCAAPRSSAGTTLSLAPERALTEDGLRLLGPDRALPVELERPLLALSTHAALGRPILGALSVSYRLVRAARRKSRGGRY
jgi:glycosyltransferase involved in cell wall biosynthesis